MSDLSADGLRLVFDTDKGDTLAALAAPGRVRIRVDAPEWSGALAYGIPRDGGTPVPLAGAPWGFLSSGDSASETGAEIVVDGLSHASGQGQYKGLLLIPFNARGTRYTRPDSATVRVELAFLAAPLVLPPEPGPASTVCAGLTPDDIRHPGLNQQAMLCSLSCVAIGSQPEAATDEALWACIEANGGQRP